jgi:hypothetical protein
MLSRRFKLADLQVEIQGRRKALAEKGIALPTDEQLRNKGGRRTEAKKRLLTKMTESAKAAGIAPAKRHI